MLGLILFFLVVAVIFAILGFGGIVRAAADILIILFWVFLAFFIISLVVRLLRR